MKEPLRRYAWSFVVALILTALVGAVSSVERLSAVGVLFAPGMLGAAIFLPRGCTLGLGWHISCRRILDECVVACLAFVVAVDANWACP
jgi:hypothetical protein